MLEQYGKSPPIITRNLNSDADSGSGSSGSLSFSNGGSSPFFQELSKTILVITQYLPSSISLALDTLCSPRSISTRMIANADVPISYVYWPANGIVPSAFFSLSSVIISRSPTILQLLSSTIIILSLSPLLSSIETSTKRSMPVEVGQATIPFFDDETYWLFVLSIFFSSFRASTFSGFSDSVLSESDDSSSSFIRAEMPTRTRIIITQNKRLRFGG